jgi:hypothetical protein
MGNYKFQIEKSSAEIKPLTYILWKIFKIVKINKKVTKLFSLFILYYQIFSQIRAEVFNRKVLVCSGMDVSKYHTFSKVYFCLFYSFSLTFSEEWNPLL